MSCPCPNSSTTTGDADITKYVVKVGNGFIKRVEDNGDIVLTLAWGLAKQCDDLTHAQSCAETYGGAVYKVTRSLEPVGVDETT